MKQQLEKSEERQWSKNGKKNQLEKHTFEMEELVTGFLFYQCYKLGTTGRRTGEENKKKETTTTTESESIKLHLIFGTK